MKRSLDRNGNSSPRKRFRDVERTSERERRGKEGSERREGDRDRVDRELSDRWVERGSERDRGSREDPRVGRNTTPKEDWHATTHRNKFYSGAGDRNHERKEQGGRSDRDGVLSGRLSGREAVGGDVNDGRAIESIEIERVS